ncbi:MAG: phage terminase small subunit P27 family [Pirellulales bacterium]
MGRNRAPIGARLLDGSYDEARDGVPLATRAGEPVKPSWLSPIAAKVWDEVVGELSSIEGLLTPLDGPALACYCLAHQRLAEAREILAAEGLILNGRRHPALMVESKAIEQICTIGQKFGLTPTSRSSLRIDPQSGIVGLHYRSADAELEDLLR